MEFLLVHNLQMTTYCNLDLFKLSKENSSVVPPENLRYHISELGHRVLHLCCLRKLWTCRTDCFGECGKNQYAS